MEWWVALAIILGSLLVLMILGIPTAFCFFIISLGGVFLLMGGQAGFKALILSIRTSIADFSLIPLVLFFLMGSVLFESGIAPVLIGALDKWLGRMPGRLGLLSVLAGVLFATLSGSSMASVAMIGQTLSPEMEKRGYKKAMSLGTIMASGGLAMLIPPSGLAVFIAVMAEMSVGKLLIAMIIPGILMAIVLGIYIVGRCWLQPSIAPSYSAGNFTFSEKAKESAIYVLPMAIIVFLVTGIIFLGIATPSEAAATGCLGCFILAAAYRKLNWRVVKTSTESSLRAGVMVLIIMASAAAYSQILVFSGANQGLVDFLMGLHLPPVMAVIGIQILIAIMGCFMPVAGILMISLPLFTPIVIAMGMDPIWFGVMTLINCEMAGLTPPFGTNLFTMKAVAPKGTTLEEVYKAAVPIVMIDIFMIALLMVFPILTQWLPKMMK